MRKNIIIAAIAAASAVLLTVSCAKQEQPGLSNEGKTFTAVIDQGITKTTITSEYKVNWEAGDQIDINGTTFSATPDATDATKASFTKVSGSDPTADYTAVYPANIIVSTQPTLPATQTYAAGKFNAPMCAIGSTETLEFKNFCGVLCFALKGTDKVRSIVVTANEQICGPFEFIDATVICFSGENEGYTVTLDCGTEGIQLNEATATNFYIYLPQATYTAGMKMTITNTNGETFEKTTTKSAEIARSNIYTFNWTPSFIPAGALAGVFTVGPNATDKVYFSQGNLTYNVSTTTWAFYEHQYDCATGYDPNLISLFTWGYDATKSINPDGTSYVEGHETKGESFNKNEDWGYVFGGESSVWRTLTKDEWTYLFNTTGRMVNGKPCYSNAVSGVTIGSATYKGVFLYPDNYNGEVVSSGSMTWDQINAAGIVFLPAAGYRSGSDVDIVGDLGSYWSSTAFDEDSAYSVLFASSLYSVYSDGLAPRNVGYSVRLITECQ